MNLHFQISHIEAPAIVFRHMRTNYIIYYLTVFSHDKH